MINIQEIIVANCTAVAILIATVISRIESKKEKFVADYLFYSMVWITICSTVVETAAFLLDGIPGNTARILLYATNAILFLMSTCVGSICVLYVDSRIFHSTKRIKKLSIIIPVQVLIVSALLVCDFCGANLIFTITENNVYQRGKLIFVPYILLFFDYAATLITALLAFKRNNHLNFFPVHIYIIPCLIGTLVQSKFYGISVEWLCASLSMQWLQINDFKKSAFVDDLSGLYNRNYYNAMLDKFAKLGKKRSIGGILFDIDRFKAINDTYGHHVGDEAIKVFGEILSEVSDSDTIAFRMGGDEFLILGIGKTTEEIKKTAQLIDEKIQNFNKSESAKYTLSATFGFAMFDNSDSITFDDFTKLLDERMYSKKPSDSN